MRATAESTITPLRHEKRLLISDCNRALLVGPKSLHLDMPYVPNLEERECVARLFTLLVPLGSLSSLLDQVLVLTDLDQPHGALPFLENHGRWRDCDFEREVRTARCPQFSSSHIFKMFAVPPSGRGSLYVLAAERYSGFECRREWNVLSPFVLLLLSSHFVDETDFRQVIWRISVSEFTVFILASSMACAWDGHGS